MNAGAFPQTPEEWEEHICSTATYFTVCRKVGVGQYSRKEFADLRAAAEEARGDRRALVYAVNAVGNYVHVTRARWEALLV